MTIDRGNAARSELRGEARLRSAALGRDIGFLAARASALAIERGNRALAPHGLRVRSYSVLSLAAEGLGPSQRELAEFLRLDPSQIVALVDELEGQGLVRREADPDDRRSKIIVATDAGLERCVVAEEAIGAAESAGELGLTSAESKTLRGLLHRAAFDV